MKLERHTATRFAIGIAGCLMFTGCSNDLAGDTPIAADGIPKLAGELTSVEGVVKLMDNGCWELRDVNDHQRWIIWPSGTKPIEGGAAVRLPNGDTITPDERITVEGQFFSRTDLPQGDNPDSMWGSKATYCLGAYEQPAELLCAEKVHLPKPS